MDRQKAIEIAEKALAETLPKIDEIANEYIDSKSIILLLKENLEEWKEE